MAAFDEALGTPIDGIELDVQASRDGIPVIFHDRSLHKVGGGTSLVGSLTARELRALDAGAWLDARFAGERIPTLDEVLDRYGARTLLLVEIKAREPGSRGAARADELTRVTVRAVVERGLAASVQILSFDERVLATVRETAESVRTVLNLARLPRGGAATWERLAPLSALSVDVRALTPRFVREAHDHGKPVFTYTCNTARTALGAARAGADGLMSDRPAWLTDLLAAPK